MQPSKVFPAVILIILCSASRVRSQERPKVDTFWYLAELRHLSARKPFLQDSPDSTGDAAWIAGIHQQSRSGRYLFAAPSIGSDGGRAGVEGLE